MTPPADEGDLHAYVDEQLPVERLAEVEARLAADPATRARLYSWRSQNERIMRLYGGQDVSILPVHLRPDGMLRSRRLALRRLATAALVALMVGVGAGWQVRGLFVTNARPLDALAQAGLDLESIAARGGLPGPLEADRRLLGALLSQALAHEVRVPDLGEVGLRLVGGRALPIAAGKVAAQLVYAEADDDRVTLYLVRPATREAADFQPVRGDGVAGLVWSYEEFHCLLFGDASQARLVTISQLVQAQLDADQPDQG